MKITLGLKNEMTQMYDDQTGRVVPCTIIDVKGTVVVGRKTVEKDGYSAVILGSGRKKSPNKPELDKYKTLGFVPRFVKEVRIKKEEDVKDDQSVQFVIGDNVQITGLSKGKGFQGVVKRWGFSGGPKTHGQSDRHRAPGSIGAGTTPGRVFKGKKMAGRKGTDKVTISNLKVVKVFPDQGLICISGAVPGNKGSLLVIKGKDSNEAQD